MRFRCVDAECCCHRTVDAVRVIVGGYSAETGQRDRLLLALGHQTDGRHSHSAAVTAAVVRPVGFGVQPCQEMTAIAGALIMLAVLHILVPQLGLQGGLLLEGADRIFGIRLCNAGKLFCAGFHQRICHRNGENGIVSKVVV